MNYSLLVMVSLAFMNTVFGMDQIEKNIVQSDTLQDEYKEFGSWNNNTDSPPIDGFFLDNDHIVIAKQNGVCASYCINDSQQSEVIFRWPRITNVKEAQLKKVMYEPQSKYICAISNVYTVNPRTLKTQGNDKHSSLERSIGQLFILKEITDERLPNPLSVLHQMISFVDPEFKFISTYSPLENIYAIFLLLDKKSLFDVLPQDNITNIAFHPLKSLCVMAVVKKTLVKNKQIVNNIVVAKTESLKGKKYVKLVSTKDWKTLWKQRGSAETLSFSPEGTYFAYIKNNRLRRALTENGEEVGSVEIPKTLQQIVSVDFNNDFEVVVSAACNEKRGIFDMNKGICTSVTDILNEPTSEVRFSHDKRLKIEIDDDRIRFYKKEN